VTLCCSHPRSNLQLKASPIPTGQDKVAGELTITQGELYTYGWLDKDISLGNWAKEVPCRRFLLFGEPQSRMSDCLVKISCATVHNSLVVPELNWYALDRLFSFDSAEMRTLRKRIGVALLACIMISEGCLMVVMKNLEPPPLNDDRFRFTGFSSPHDCWNAFCELVKEVLLPMANGGIVHVDVRFHPLTRDIRNVVSYDTGLGSRKLMVIDFESLLCYKINAKKSTEQTYAISPKQIAEAKGSIHAFLFWQVLWVAYGWWSKMTDVDLVISSDFFVDFFSPDGPPLASFGAMLSVEDMKNLQIWWDKGRSNTGSRSMSDEIKKTLIILGKCFPKGHTTKS
jgi:hypothetical protein